jgi:hypothetical protein
MTVDPKELIKTIHRDMSYFNSSIVDVDGGINMLKKNAGNRISKNLRELETWVDKKLEHIESWK